MSETPETPTTPTTVATTTSTAPVKPYWLYRFAAWVVVVAGILFIVSTVFFAGFRIAHLGHHGCHHHWAQQHSMGQGPHHHAQGAGFRGEFAHPQTWQVPASVAPSLAPATP
jgi:hypothetical protein